MALSLGSLYVKLGAEDSDFQRKMTAAEKKIERFSSAAGKAAKATGAIFAGLTAGIGVATKAWGEQEKAVTKLRVALRNIGKESSLADFEKQASALQKVTTYGDEATLSAQALAVALMGDAEAVMKLTPIVQDFAAVRDLPITTAFDQLGRAIGSGTLGQLTRYGVVLSETEKEQFALMDTMGRAEFMIEKLGKSYTGAARALADTGSGAVIQFKNALGDLIEQVGKLMDSRVKEFFQSLTNVISAATDKLSSLSDETRKQISSWVELAVKITGATTALLTFSALLPTIIRSIKVIATIVSVVLSPALLVAVAVVGALILAFGGFRRHGSEAFERVSAAVRDAAAWMADAFGGVLKWLRDAFTNVEKFIIGVLNKVSNAFKDMMVLLFKQSIAIADRLNNVFGANNPLVNDKGLAKLRDYVDTLESVEFNITPDAGKGARSAVLKWLGNAGKMIKEDILVAWEKFKEIAAEGGTELKLSFLEGIDGVKELFLKLIPEEWRDAFSEIFDEGADKVGKSVKDAVGGVGKKGSAYNPFKTGDRFDPFMGSGANPFTIDPLALQAADQLRRQEQQAAAVELLGAHFDELNTNLDAWAGAQRSATDAYVDAARRSAEVLSRALNTGYALGRGDVQGVAGEALNKGATSLFGSGMSPLGMTGIGMLISGVLNSQGEKYKDEEGNIQQTGGTQKVLASASGVLSAAFETLGKILEPLAPAFDALGDAVAAVGAVFAVFEPIIKVVADIIEFFARVIYNVVRGLMLLIRFVDKIVFFADLMSDSMDRIADSTFDQWMASRRASQGLDDVATAAQQTAAEMYNVPEVFKISLARYRAALAEGELRRGGGGGTDVPGSGGDTGYGAGKRGPPTPPPMPLPPGYVPSFPIPNSDAFAPGVFSPRDPYSGDSIRPPPDEDPAVNPRLPTPGRPTRHYAMGAIFTKPTTIRVGEAGPEALAPIGPGGGDVSFGGSTIFRIGQIVLPGVRNYEDFIEEMRRRTYYERGSNLADGPWDYSES